MMEENMRQIFRWINKLMILNWRLGYGPYLSLWPDTLGRYMVIAHIGRKTGLRRLTPVNYTEFDGDIYCTAGFGSISDWYRNLMAKPSVEVWLPDGRFMATAEDITSQPGAFPLLKAVLMDSGFAAKLAGVNPRVLSDDALREATRDYRLLRIRRGEALTGAGGPGDLAWVWPVSAALLVVVVALARRLRRRG